MIRIVVNGKLEDLEAPITVAEFLRLKGVTGRAVVERNLQIVRKDAYEAVKIEDGDELEIVQMMAGG